MNAAGNSMNEPADSMDEHAAPIDMPDPMASDSMVPDSGAKPPIDADAGLPEPDAGASSPSCVLAPQVEGKLRAEWVLSLGHGEANSMVVDANGNAIVAGYFIDELDVGGEKLTSSGNDAFVIALDPHGKKVWARTFPSSSVYAAAVDAAGNLYIVTDSKHAGDTELAKLDADGKTTWSKSFTLGWGPLVSLAVSPQGDSAIASVAAEPVDFGGGAPAGSGYTGFVAAFDTGGNHLFDKSWSNQEMAADDTSVAFDEDGNVIVASSFSGTLDLGGAQATAASGSGFAAKFDASGKLQWQQVSGDFSAAQATASAADVTLFAGSFTGALSVGDSSAVAKSLGNLFVTSVDAQGKPSYLTTLSTSSGDGLRTLAADPGRGAVAFTDTHDYVELGGKIFGPSGLLLFRLDATGSVESTALFSTPLGGRTRAVAVDSQHDILAFGTYEGKADLGTGLIANTRTYVQTMFVAKYVEGPALHVIPESCPVIDTASDRAPGETVLATGDTLYMTPTALLLHGDTLFWTTEQDVFSVPLDGGAPNVLATGQATAWGLASDGESLYWANAGQRAQLGPEPLGALMKMAFDGGAPTTVVGDLPVPVSFALGDTQIFFLSGGASAADGALQVMPLSGGSPSSLLTGLTSPGPIIINGEDVFFASGNPSTDPLMIQLQHVASDGSSQLLTTIDRQVSGIVADDTRVYWTEADSRSIDSSRDDGRVRSMSLTGGEVMSMADAQPGPMGLMRDGDDLIWANVGSFSIAGSERTADILTLPREGGAIKELLPRRAGIGAFAVDAAHLAWVESAADYTWAIVVRER